MTASLAERFWCRVDRRSADECWPWSRYLNPNGYGFFTFGPAPQTTKPVHRLAFELAVGPIPDGLQIDHLCRNRACCNPAHLEPVSRAENDRRALPYLKRGAENVQGAKTHCPAGHPYDETNTRRLASKPNARYCRECQRIYHKAWRARKREAAVRDVKRLIADGLEEAS